MHNFVFHNPTKVLFGRGTLAAVGSETTVYGRRVLLVHGRVSARSSGRLEQVLQSLAEAGTEVSVLGGIRPNPTVEQAVEAIRQARIHGAEVICALGGGSVIDVAKAVAAGIVVEHDIWKFFTGKKSVKAALPVIAVSTLAGSGSEMNSGMVLTNGATRQKFGFAHRLLYPRVAIMDPETTFSVSGEYTACGAVDALAHLLEFYLTTTAGSTIVQDRYMEGLAQSIMVSCRQALAYPYDYEARAALMWSAGLALNGLAVAGLGKVGFPMHLIEHSLSALYDVPHGAGLAVVIPGWLRYHARLIPERICVILQGLFGGNGSDPDAADSAIERFEDWLRGMGLATSLAGLGIPAIDIDRLAENALPLAKIWRMRDYDKEKIAAILRCCDRSAA